MNLAPLRVLIIEDSEDDYLILRDLLGDASDDTLELLWVSDYDEGYALITQDSFDACLLDHRLGGRTGLDLLQAIPESNPTPIILMTGQDDRALDTAAARAGAVDYLVKGQLSAPLLERSVRYAMENARREARLAEALRESHLLQTAVSNLTDAMIVTDPRKEDNPIIFANPAFSAITGYSHDEIVGRNCRILQGADTDPQTVRQIREALQNNLPFSGVVRNYRKDGTPFWNDLRITPIFNEAGQLVNFVGLQSDITPQRQAEIALRESEANLAQAQQIARLGSWEAGNWSYPTLTTSTVIACSGPMKPIAYWAMNRGRSKSPTRLSFAAFILMIVNVSVQRWGGPSAVKNLTVLITVCCGRMVQNASFMHRRPLSLMRSLVCRSRWSEWARTSPSGSKRKKP
jgi:PAS domain S-box-containing protein